MKPPGMSEGIVPEGEEFQALRAMVNSPQWPHLLYHILNKEVEMLKHFTQMARLQTKIKSSKNEKRLFSGQEGRYPSSSQKLYPVVLDRHNCMPVYPVTLHTTISLPKSLWIRMLQLGQLFQRDLKTALKWGWSHAHIA